jgi:hypothetical protein
MKRAGAAAVLAFAAAAANAQEYSRFLQCEGTFAGPERSVPAHADLALRSSNRTALIQRSNVLPVGEKLQYVPTPASYSMTYRLPERGTTVVALPGWLHSTVLVLLPDLKRLNQIRIGIDRQTGELQGTLLNEQEQSLGSFRMQCQSRSEQEMAAPKF